MFNRNNAQIFLGLWRRGLAALWRKVPVGLLGAALLVLGMSEAGAVPAFARQTGQGCVACHVGGFGPQLTAFGRAFKMNAYTLGANRDALPLSAMLVASFTHTASDQPPASPRFRANDNFTALQQASVFLAGGLSEHLGVFAQATYSDTAVPAQLAMDNIELRYARPIDVAGVGSVLGFSLNNNPTLSDVWNTAPAWQYNYMSPPFGSAGPVVSPLLYGLGQGVIGASAYVQVGTDWYVEGGLYHRLDAHSANLLHAGSAAIDGQAPYVRAWYARNFGAHTFEVGTGMFSADLNPGGVAAGPRDHYRDTGLDGTYQWQQGAHQVAFNALYMHESQDLAQSRALGSATNAGNTLDSASANIAYWWQNTYGVTLAAFDTHGSADAAMYGSGSAFGSATGSPNSAGTSIELNWNPYGKNPGDTMNNWRLGLQYTMFSKYLGARRNFDGNGTDARAMNTLYLYVWTAI